MVFTIVNNKPLRRDLYNYITPRYATQWKVIGTLLDLPSETLNIIERNHMFQVDLCCNAMLGKWLELDTSASWGKLFTVIESPAVTSKLDQSTITDKGKLYTLLYAIIIATTLLF